MVTPLRASSDARYCARAASVSRRMRPHRSSSQFRREIRPACKLVLRFVPAGMK